MIIISAVIIILALIAWGTVSTVLSHKETINSPQYTCLHAMETIQTRTGSCTTEYLSTCKKCGKQKHHYFSGLN